MVSLMLRRWAMMQTVASLPEWDYVWEYTEGLPDTNYGWTAPTAGTVQMKSNGLLMKGTGSVYYNNPSATASIGVLEAEFTPQTGVTNQMNGAFRFGSTTGCVFILFGQYNGSKVIKWLNNSTFANSTTIGSWVQNTTYKVTLILNSGFATVKLGDTALVEDKSVSDIVYPGSIRFGVQNSTNGAIFKSLKYKIGRL